MVDFATPKRTSRGKRGTGLLLAAICLIGLVGYALLENQIRSPGGNDGAVALTDALPTK